MGVHVRRWGNSAAVRLPASALSAAGLKIDDPVEIREEEGRIVIARAAPQPVTLQWLLEDLSPDQLHGEIDFGRPAGREFR